ncbi:MAG: hypothetical protein ACRD2N_25030, partial [Vicinamibacterales bacterium]
MDFTALLVSLLSGAAGGNIGGATVKNSTLGGLGNSLTGAIGGGLGSVLGPMLGIGGAAASAGATGGMDLGALLTNA